MPEVTAYVYDITQGMAAQMSVAIIGKQIEFIPHTGIACFGKEYFFGSGPCIGVPGKSVPVKVHQVLNLGNTDKTCEELEAYIRDVLANEHTEANYSLLSHNCNHYADDVAKFLLKGTGIPLSIVNTVEEVFRDTGAQGQKLRVILENMEKMTRGAGGRGASAPSAAAAAPQATPSASSANPDLEAALSEMACSNSEEVRRAALGMLVKIAENVEKNPTDPKFRRIKMNSAAFSKKVAGAAGGVDAMVAAGWLPDCTPEGEDAWLCNDDAVASQVDVRKRFEAELAKLPALVGAAPAPAPVAAAPAAGGYGGMGGMGGMPGMGGMGGPGGMAGMPPGMQQMMQNPAMMQQAQQMMQNNPGMQAQAQQMMQDPNMMAQMQQMMQDPQAMAQMQQMMGGMGRGGPM
eukprot:CAMPEP_0115058252 /NCGR_PEP_ID=MMETSP0227-20121206/6242_1 /TAXON_ID=89957 /ORGANISM="Polarella glacialis, Strain CCMP 1383" /LENGTH=403 /DNA_ID=CAMNT_0002443209 /DNA_START=64 /DNA_END=1275 /DNA_ORIENTATION=+